LFCELAGERADRAAAACLALDLELDECVEPAVDAGPRVEVVEQLAVDGEDGVRGDVDHGADEVVAVVEVVVELTAALRGTVSMVRFLSSGWRSLRAFRTSSSTRSALRAIAAADPAAVIT
jgi:hypothetical protein